AAPPTPPSQGGEVSGRLRKRGSCLGKALASRALPEKKMRCRARILYLLAHLLCLFLGLLDRADVHEGAFGQLVPLAVADLLEAADSLGELGVLAGFVGKRFGDEEGLREEALNPARAVHDELVVLRKLVDAQDGDDIAELLVALEDLLHSAGDFVVLLPNILR